MSFTENQTRWLRASVHARRVKEREVDGQRLRYVEGWFVIAQANRIFGHGGWDREILASECVWRKPVNGLFAAAYVTRVRVRVRAGGEIVSREGIGAGQFLAETPGQAHERAAKAAETDATKRALVTFGDAFGLTLYRDARGAERRRRDPIRVERAPAREEAGDATPPDPDLPQPADSPIGRIDKSQLTVSTPRRLRSPEHLAAVRQEPCLVCGRAPSQAHHLRFTQPRALGRKVSDEYTVPLCATHHDELHRAGDEGAWWDAHRIEPVEIAAELWRRTRERR